MAAALMSEYVCTELTLMFTDGQLRMLSSLCFCFFICFFFKLIIKADKGILCCQHLPTPPPPHVQQHINQSLHSPNFCSHSLRLKKQSRACKLWSLHTSFSWFFRFCFLKRAFHNSLGFHIAVCSAWHRKCIKTPRATWFESALYTAELNIWYAVN